MLLFQVRVLISPNTGGSLPEGNSHASCRRIFPPPRYTGSTSRPFCRGETRPGNRSLHSGPPQFSCPQEWEQHSDAVGMRTMDGGCEVPPGVPRVQPQEPQRASGFRCSSCLGVQGSSAPGLPDALQVPSGCQPLVTELRRVPFICTPFHCCLVLFLLLCWNLPTLTGHDFALCVNLSITHRVGQHCLCGIM